MNRTTHQLFPDLHHRPHHFPMLPNFHPIPNLQSPRAIRHQTINTPNSTTTRQKPHHPIRPTRRNIQNIARQPRKPNPLPTNPNIYISSLSNINLPIHPKIPSRSLHLNITHHTLPQIRNRPNKPRASSRIRTYRQLRPQNPSPTRRNFPMPSLRRSATKSSRTTPGEGTPSDLPGKQHPQTDPPQTIDPPDSQAPTTHPHPNPISPTPTAPTSPPKSLVRWPRPESHPPHPPTETSKSHFAATCRPPRFRETPYAPAHAINPTHPTTVTQFRGRCPNRTSKIESTGPTKKNNPPKTKKIFRQSIAPADPVPPSISITCRIATVSRCPRPTLSPAFGPAIKTSSSSLSAISVVRSIPGRPSSSPQVSPPKSFPFWASEKVTEEISIGNTAICPSPSRFSNPF